MINFRSNKQLAFCEMLATEYHQDSNEGYAMHCDEQLPKEFSLSRSRIMYIEDKSAGLEGDARIGRVFFSKTKKTLYYAGMKFQSLKGSGFKANYYEVESGDHYWISGPHKDLDDRLYGGNAGVQVDADVADEYYAYLDDK